MIFGKRFFKIKSLETLSKPQTELTCSVANLMAASLPMVVSFLSSALMHLFDRSILSYFTRSSMDGAMIAQQAGNLLMIPLLCFASMSEVFVGQFNGAGKQQKTSLPIFQIILFLISCYACIAPFVWHHRSFIIASPCDDVYNIGCVYFKWVLLTIPVQIVYSSLSAFFVGTRRPSVIFYSALTSNIANIILDIILIFGLENLGLEQWFPARGAQGAAIATLIATLIGTLIMLGCFLTPYNATYYNTRHIRFNKALLKKNIALGLPFSFCYFVEMSVWLWVLKLLSHISPDEVTIQNICVAVLNFFFFIIDGFQKGIMALSSNCLGAGKSELLPRLIRSFLKASIGVSALVSLPLVFFYPNMLKNIFDLTDPVLISQFQGPLCMAWLVITGYLYSTSCFCGILSSGGDTTFLTCIKMSSILLCVALPMGLCFRHGSCTAFKSWAFSVLLHIVNTTFFFLRYRYGKWKHSLQT